MGPLFFWRVSNGVYKIIWNLPDLTGYNWVLSVASGGPAAAHVQEKMMQLLPTIAGYSFQGDARTLKINILERPENW